MKLPSGISSHIVPGVNGLDMHLFEAGDREAPAIILLHGYPEIAYSWMKMLTPLANAGYRAIAPDLRGYGQTTGWDADYNGDLRQFRILNLTRDVVALVSALGIRSVEAVAGHDFGASVAAICALVRPDIFKRLVLMTPVAGPPTLPYGSGARPATPDPIHAELARFNPPRKHYQWYNSTRKAVEDMTNPPQGLRPFLRAYYHQKSADNPANKPVMLRAWNAEELSIMPNYYIMPLDADMPSVTTPQMPSSKAIAACKWLTDEDIDFHAREFERTGWVGALKWYRCQTEGVNSDLDLYSGRTIDVPAIFIGGASDWGVQQIPGGLERLQTQICTRMTESHIIPGAGHWLPQEQPDKAAALMLRFLRA
jgi:pimeloyl-ACP methyl ester carboxylesterase